MILYFAATLLIGFVVGLVWERYRWVRAAKNSKVIEVDGDIYSAKKVADTFGGSVEE